MNERANHRSRRRRVGAARVAALTTTALTATGMILSTGPVANAETTTLSPTMTTNATVTPSLTGTILGNLHAGDRVVIVATLHTSDVNENGEGEYLEMHTEPVGGLSTTLLRYNVPVTFSFTATVNGESVVGGIQGGDGDEYANLRISLNPKPAPTFDKQSKEYLNWVADRYDESSDGYEVGGPIACDFVLPLGKWTEEQCSAVADALSTLDEANGAKARELAQDPPDPNFQEIAQPDVHRLPDLTVAGTGLTQGGVDAFNALAHNEEDSIAVAEAAYLSINRASGAEDAGDTYWKQRQVDALHGYMNQLADLYDAQAGLRSGLVTAFQADGFPDLGATPDDVLNFELQDYYDGLPDGIVQDLQQLGASSDEISQAQQVAYVQDVNAVPASVLAALGDATLLSDLHAAADALRKDATAGTTPPMVTVSTDSAVVWPPNNKRVDVTLTGRVTEGDSPTDPASVRYDVVDEYGTVQPSGFIALAGDGTFTVQVPLEASRGGDDKDGRHYTIRVSADNSAGTGSASTAVVVEHDMRS